MRFLLYCAFMAGFITCGLLMAQPDNPHKAVGVTLLLLLITGLNLLSINGKKGLK
jgi:hypothetical protein